MSGENRWHLIPDYLRRRVDALKIRLGGRCCGYDCDVNDLSKLEFHHKYGKSWKSSQYGPAQRIRIYEQEAEMGLIDLLCVDCHRFAGSHPDICFCPVCRSGPDF